MIKKQSLLHLLNELYEEIIELRLNIQSDNEDFICETCMETLNWLHDFNTGIEHIMQFIEEEF